jgi:hypothetical protein
VHPTNAASVSFPLAARQTSFLLRLLCRDLDRSAVNTREQLRPETRRWCRSLLDRGFKSLNRGWTSELPYCRGTIL